MVVGGCLPSGTDAVVFPAQCKGYLAEYADTAARLLQYVVSG